MPAWASLLMHRTIRRRILPDPSCANALKEVMSNPDASPGRPTKPFDSANDIRTPEDAAAYPRMTVAAVRTGPQAA
ncbi:hypothetical protein J2W76_002791 [Methylorubrum zatmanii]|nr:hypothetical protein [Methylorubrum zatmanii]MCP1553840.1 hypothetical protein [Methylorubrum extorquens]MCP1579848.1 hypothetical protein [Methylorubrum extorquens]